MYQMCPRCGDISRRKRSQPCLNNGCGEYTIPISSKTMATLARKFYTSDFDVASAVCNLIKGAEPYRPTMVQIII